MPDALHEHDSYKSLYIKRWLFLGSQNVVVSKNRRSTAAINWTAVSYSINRSIYACSSKNKTSLLFTMTSHSASAMVILQGDTNGALLSTFSVSTLAKKYENELRNSCALARCDMKRCVLATRPASISALKMCTYVCLTTRPPDTSSR
jgi:hypothetical protein